MQPRPAYFDQALRDGGRVVAKCDVLVNGVAVTGATGIPITSGSVETGRSQIVRRSCDIVIPESSLAPALATDLLSPYGSELRLWSGVVLPDGTEASVCVGTFVIWDVETALPFDGVRIAGYDRMKLVDQARFLYPRTLEAGSIIGRLSQLIAEAVPWAGPLDSSGVGDYTAGQVTYDESRSDAVKDMARTVGAECYCDPFGTFVLRDIPDPGGPVVWLLDAGQALSTVRRKLSRDGVYNAVVARSSATGIDAPVTAVATDDDPYSPTYAGGVSLLTGRSFGLSPLKYSSPLFGSDQDQAQTAAASLLRDNTGLQRSVSVTGVVQPALEPGDVIGIDTSAGVEQHLAESFTIRLGPSDGMQIDTRTTSYRLAS